MSNPWKYSISGNTIIVYKLHISAAYYLVLEDVESTYTIKQKIKKFPRRVQSLLRHILRKDIK